MSESLTKVQDVDWLPAIAGRAQIVARCNGRLPMATLAQAGIGLACLPRFVGDASGLRALPARSPPTRQLWLGYHRDARAVPRVRATSAFLTDGVGRLRTALNPQGG
jgi:DNA-binding transcriptional LysR family regulator